MHASKKVGHGYLIYPLVVIVTWGIVPAFAKLGALDGALTTMYVNWFAVVGLVVIMAINGSLWKMKQKLPYAKMVMVGMIWPLAYSLVYFTSITTGSPSLTTVGNYMWPLFYLVLATVFWGKRFGLNSWLCVSMAVVSVVVMTLVEKPTSIHLVALLLALGAAFFQAWYSALTEGWEYDPWIVTLVVSIVTAVGSTIYAGMSGSLAWIPLGPTWFYLGIIGVISNGIGFWAFLKGHQVSSDAGEGAKTILLMLLCLVPLAQVVLLPILGVEAVTWPKIIAVVVISLSLFAYRLSLKKPSKESGDPVLELNV